MSSYRSLAVGFSGSNMKSQTKLSYSRYKHNGLDKNTVLEGSGIESRSNRSRKSSFTSPPNSSSISTNKTQIQSENWKEKYLTLQKKFQSIRKELELKEKLINELRNQNQALSDSHKEELDRLNQLLEGNENTMKNLKKESNNKFNEHSLQKRELEKSIEDLQESMLTLKELHTDTLSIMAKEHQKEICSLQEQHQSQINQIKQSHSDNIREKDNIIENLKGKLANTFNDSSKERQAQIDELIKELQRVSDEAEYVKSALRKFKSSNKDCTRCHIYQEKFKEVSLELTKKERICKDLYLVCSKMEKQLSQKDDLMEIWNAVKAHK